MNALGKFQSVYAHFHSNKELPEGAKTSYPNSEDFENRMETLMDEFVPGLDNQSSHRGTDIVPEKGLVGLPKFHKSGAFFAEYQGNSAEGTLTTSYQNNKTKLTRDVFFSEGGIDSLHLWHLEDQNKIKAVHHHIDRDNPENSYTQSKDWVVE